MEQDPVCGMSVEPSETPYKSEYKGKTYHFCTSRCKTTFEEAPDEYVRISRGDVVAERKVVIVGTGYVGSTFGFALMISGLANSIVLVDRNRNLAEGHAMDLNHSLPFAQPTSIRAGDYPDCKNASVVVVTAGVAQKPGESRLDLVRKNTEIFKDIIPRITRHNPRILLIVSNPVDILTYVALKTSDFPMNRVIGSGTALDTARFRYLIGEHCGVDPRNVHGYVIGEHGDSEVPVWSRVAVGGVPLEDYCPTCGKSCSESVKQEIFERVKLAAYEIIDKKGATYFAIGLALVRIVGNILRNENSVQTLSTLLDDYYGISDVCLSVPVVLNRNGISRSIRIRLDDSEAQALRQSAGTLKRVIAGLDI
jgi:L-lactate dehydrogenase